MGIRATSHIAIGVHDMERELRFYRDLLGLRVAVDRDERYDDQTFDPPIERVRHAVYLRWADGPDASFIVLDHQRTVPARGEPAELFQIGVHHVALWVDDLEPYLAGLEAAGGSIVFGPHPSGGNAYGEPEGSHVVTVGLRDPEGNVIQLDQRVVSDAA
jgi:catechol 2,3-dioxygenase-like lactoylglutathione lyase family enzyme